MDTVAFRPYNKKLSDIKVAALFNVERTELSVFVDDLAKLPAGLENILAEFRTASGNKIPVRVVKRELFEPAVA